VDCLSEGGWGGHQQFHTQLGDVVSMRHVRLAGVDSEMRHVWTCGHVGMCSRVFDVMIDCDKKEVKLVVGCWKEVQVK
jgi:hypothetical protein